MKKTPIIAGLVGLGILGGAYLGGAYLSSNTAMEKLHQWVDYANQASTERYDIVEENKGLFSSTAHVTVTDTFGSAPVVDTQLTFHHGILSTDIDGKLMFNIPSWQQLEVIKNNGGMDVSGHVNTFKAKGNFIQFGLTAPANADSKGKEFSFVLRAESSVDFDQSTQDKLHALIAQGVDGQEKATSDGKETNILVSMKGHGPKAELNIDVPVLYQQNSNAYDTSTTMYVRLDGKDVLKPNGIQSIDGVSHYTKGEHPLGSYMYLNVPGTLSIPSEQGMQTLADMSVLADVSDKGAQGTMRIARTSVQEGDRSFASGPVTMSMMFNASAYNEMLALGNSLKGMTPEARSVALKNFAWKLPDIHAEAHDIVMKKQDENTKKETNDSMKAIALDIVRDVNTPVTHVNMTASDIISDEVKHGDFSQKIMVDQLIVDTAFNISHTLGSMRDQPSMEQIDSMQQQALVLLQSSPRIVLDELRLSAENLPHVFSATGEVKVAGDAIHSLGDIDNKIFTAHFTITGLPSELVEQAHNNGLENISADKPIHVDFVAGRLTINGKEVR